MHPSGRFLSNEINDENFAGVDPSNPHTQRILETNNLPYSNTTTANTVIIDDIDSIIDEFNRARVINSLTDTKRVFCISCETTNVNGVLSLERAVQRF